MFRAALIGLLVAFPGVALAQTPGSNEAPKDRSLYFGTEDLQKIMDAVPSAPGGKPAGFSKRLFNASTFSTAFIRLVAPDQPHAHGAWSEVFLVKDGAGVLETGGTITGKLSNDSATHKELFVNPQPAAPAQRANAARRANEGDLAGTDVIGGKRQNVKPGDVILIPAGVSHRWVQVDRPVVYLDIKFPKAN